MTLINYGYDEFEEEDEGGSGTEPLLPHKQSINWVSRKGHVSKEYAALLAEFRYDRSASEFQSLLASLAAGYELSAQRLPESKMTAQEIAMAANALEAAIHVSIEPPVAVAEDNDGLDLVKAAYLLLRFSPLLVTVVFFLSWIYLGLAIAFDAWSHVVAAGLSVIGSILLVGIGSALYRRRMF